MIRVTFEAGALIRGPLVSQMKNLAFSNGIELDFDESKSFFYSEYRVTVRGPSEETELWFCQVVRENMERMNREYEERHVRSSPERAKGSSLYSRIREKFRLGSSVR